MLCFMLRNVLYSGPEAFVHFVQMKLQTSKIRIVLLTGTMVTERSPGLIVMWYNNYPEKVYFFLPSRSTDAPCGSDDIKAR